MPDNVWEYILKFRYQIFFALTGLILILSGLFLSKINLLSDSDIQIIEETAATNSSTIIVEVNGAVKNPGVYEFQEGARINDALQKAGGIKEDANANYLEKIINRAAKLVDGQKIYIPFNDEQLSGQSASNSGGSSSGSSALGESTQSTININTATQKELESLWGIGPVTAQNIIEQRPYSTVEDLINKKILKSNVYETNKNLLSVY